MKPFCSSLWFSLQVKFYSLLTSPSQFGGSVYHVKALCSSDVFLCNLNVIAVSRRPRGRKRLFSTSKLCGLLIVVVKIAVMNETCFFSSLSISPHKAAFVKKLMWKILSIFCDHIVEVISIFLVNDAEIWNMQNFMSVNDYKLILKIRPQFYYVTQ